LFALYDGDDDDRTAPRAVDADDGLDEHGLADLGGTEQDM